MMLLVACAGVSGACSPGVPAPAETRARAARNAFLTGADSLETAAARLERDAARGSLEDVRHAFHAARAAYKHIEVLAEYYAPQTAQAVNGPALERSGDEPPYAIQPPTGFQVIEEALFPDAVPEWRTVLAVQAPLVRRSAVRMRVVASGTEPTDAHIFEAARYEIARVVTLGLAGFDAGSSGNGPRESAAALRGISAALSAYRGDIAARDAGMAYALDSTLLAAAAYLHAHPNAERLDRIAFITDFANPAWRALDDARRVLAVALPSTRPVWSAAAPTLFERGAFDPSALAPLDAPGHSDALAALGRALFFDARLSGNGTRSCATCHQPERAFTDGLTRRTSLVAGAADIPNRVETLVSLARNTPTVVNAGLQPASFYDQRATYLEDQITDVMANAAEMGHSADAAAQRLDRDPQMRARFAAVLGPSDTVVTSLRLRRALAAYLRSLQSLDSRFDRAVRGEQGALAPEERAGFTVFMGKARCGTCHFAPLFNGATPPLFTDAEVEVIGVPGNGARGAAIDSDVGRMAVTSMPTHRGAFKTPTLRNVALTAPYMHNGRFRTLEEVVDFYDAGGGAGMGAHVPNQTLPADSLHLSRGEKRALVRFMRALTDTGYVRR